MEREVGLLHHRIRKLGLLIFRLARGDSSTRLCPLTYASNPYPHATQLFTMIIGFFDAFLTLTNQIFEPVGYSSDTAGYIGAACIVSGIVAYAFARAC